MKFSLKGYYAPTPKKMRKWGDILLALSGLFSAISLRYNWYVGVEISFWLGILSKYGTNFFIDDKQGNKDL